MNQLHLDYRETWMHKVNPSLKLILSIVFFFIVLFSNHPVVLGIYAIIFFVLLLLFSGHSKFTLLLLFIPLTIVFVTSSMTMILFGKGDTTWFRFGLIHISEESFFRGVHIGLKSINMALIGILFSLTTRPVAMFYSLMQQCKVPPKYAYSFMAALRLLPVFWEELQTLRMALKVRGQKFRKGPAGLYDRLKSYAVPLLAQSIRRAGRIALAMEAKRFSLTKHRTYYYQFGFSIYDFVYIAIFTILLASAYIMGVSISSF